MDCCLLIGGASRRMGRSKLDLPFGGSTFAQRAIDAARPVFERIVAVQRAEQPPLDSIPTIFEPPRELQAPLFGLWRALEDAKARCFILAIDYPLLTPEVLRYLAARSAQSQAAMTVPRWNGKLQMLCAGYSPSLLPRFAPRLAAGQLNLRGLSGDIEIIEEQELRSRFRGEPLMNVNTRQELEAAAGYL